MLSAESFSFSSADGYKFAEDQHPVSAIDDFLKQFAK
jgi:hypothetical protein